jgi:hypothetical protein
MCKYGGPMLCQTSMELLPGIVVGTVNGLQFNEWETNGVTGRGVWQLIAIFDKETKFMARVCS